MVAESALAPEPAGPLEPQAARLIEIATAEQAIAALRNVRFFIWDSIRLPGSSLMARL
jgi:hypothetical protein